MPGTLWSAPVPALNSNSEVCQLSTTATLTDIAPAQVIINPPQLNVGTRVRLTAHGSYIATTTASTLTFGFYMTAASTATIANPLVATSAVLGVGPAVTAVAVSGIPWGMLYWGRISLDLIADHRATNAQIVGRGTCGTARHSPRSQASRRSRRLSPRSPSRRPARRVSAWSPTSPSWSASAARWPQTPGLTSVTCDELTCELLG